MLAAYLVEWKLDRRELFNKTFSLTSRQIVDPFICPCYYFALLHITAPVASVRK